MALIRVDVLMVGINRSLSYTHSSIDQEIIKRLSARVFDINLQIGLIETTDGRINNPRSNESGELEKPLPRSMAQFTVSYMKASQLELEINALLDQLRHFPDPHSDGHKSLANLLTSLAAQRQLYRSAHRSGAVVVFLRPDCAIDGRLWIRSRVVGLWLAQKLGISAGFFPSWGRSGGVNDRFAILSSLSAVNYFERLGRIAPEDWPAGIYAEQLLASAMRGTFVIDSVKANINRVRIGGVVEPRDLERVQRKRKKKRRLWQ